MGSHALTLDVGPSPFVVLEISPSVAGRGRKIFCGDPAVPENAHRPRVFLIHGTQIRWTGVYSCAMNQA
jgi:hypothetical protein